MDDGKSYEVPAPGAAPGIVIRDIFEPLKPPRVAMFIWGWKVRPVPALPYGRQAEV